jgi:cysteine desulfurase
VEPSHVAAALGFDNALSRSLVRFSLGRESTMEEVERVALLLPEIVSRSQRLEKKANSL